MRASGRQLILHAALLGALGLPLPGLAATSVISDGTVRFEAGSSQLTPESERVLDRLAALLKRKADLDPVELIGHADDRGAEATNRALSLGRARAVRQALIRRGIRPSRLLVQGAGSAVPLSREDSDAARQLNRRVEVWVTPQYPVAEVTRVQRDVQSKEAAAVQWTGARVGQALRRLARVRTEKASASEVTFRSQDKVQLGPEALVVIHDTPSRSRINKAEVVDVEVEQGTIFAAMAAKDRSLEVRTRPSRVSVRSKRTRVDVRRRAGVAKQSKQVSTVSVFDGRSDVAAQGKTVSVKEGYGTRVKEGEAPEPARPLPLPPTWATRDPWVGFEGQPVNLAWTRAPGVEAVEVQLGLHDDPEVKSPHQLWRVNGDQTQGGRATAGLYHMRLVGVDERDISGAPGRALRLVSLPVPVDEAGVPLPVSGRRVRLTKPGILSMGGLGVGTLSSTTSSTAAVVGTFIRPGLHTLPFVLSAGEVKVQDSLQVWVDTATLTAQVGAPVVAGDRSRTEITFTVATASGAVDGLQWTAGVVPEPTRRLAVPAPGARALLDCQCGSPPGASRVEALGAGRYRWVLDRALPSVTSSVTVRLYEARGRLAAELAVPIADVARARPGESADDKSGLFVGARVGALVSHSDAPTAEFSAELGYRLALGRGLEVDLSVEGGWLGRAVAGQKVNAFPVLARASLGLDLGAPRVYAGGGGGLRFTDPGPDLAGAAVAFVGVGYRFSHSEVLLEGAYRMVGQVDAAPEELAGWAVIVGYRWGTFRVQPR